jgi:acetate kinase
MNVLVLNAGSSSLKFRLLRIGTGDPLLAGGLVEKWGTSQATLKLEVSGQSVQSRPIAAASQTHAAEHVIDACRELGIDATGHRVVHGGPKFREPVRVTPQVIDSIREVSHLAPLHNALALAGIEAALRALSNKPAVAVFDTAFHRTLPEVAALYAIPPELAEQHALRRYGFHGISHQYVSQKLIQCLDRPAAGTRLITCHLGNGASVCAIRDGISVDTSMGFTPMEGLVMGTRSGDIDPGLVLHLIINQGMKPAEVDHLLNYGSGLLGLSGRSGDMREIEQAAAEGDRRADLAREMFAYRVRKYIGAYAAVLGGVDAIAFAGGIGEHSPSTRQRICEGLSFLGAVPDQKRNEAASGTRESFIHAGTSRVQLWVIPTDEEMQIAREVNSLLGG